MREIVVHPHLSAEEARGRVGTFAAEADHGQPLSGDCRLLRPDGSLLAVLLAKGISEPAGRAMWAAVRSRVAMSFNRGAASGLPRENKPRRRGGRSATNTTVEPVASSILGFFDRNPRMPFCRPTAFVEQYPEAYRACLPAIREADALFALHAPEAYSRQKAVAARTSPDFLIADSVFTTVTLNRNFRTAYHLDAGDLPEGFAAMSCYRGGRYTGAQLTFPRYRVALDLGNRDLVLFDPHEVHGNTRVRPLERAWERITCVHYYRAAMRFCGSAAEELALAAGHDTRSGARRMNVCLAPPEGAQPGA